MKTLTSTILIFVFVFLQCTSVFTQDETEGQKWYCYEEVIIPALLNEYASLSMEIVDLCKEKEFPYTFHVWSSDGFSFQLWTPINSLDDIEGLNKAWKGLLEDWDKDKLERFTKTKLKNFSSVIAMQPELTYEPQTSRLTLDEIGFSEWKEYYLVTDKEDEATAMSKKIRERLQANNHEDPRFCATGELGYEDPCLIVWSLYKDEADYYSQQTKFEEMLDEDLKEVFSDFIPCIRTVKTRYMLYLSNLSYIAE